MTRTVVFVCEHGAFRSRIAAAYFNAAAAPGWGALSAVREPQAEASPRLGPLLAGRGAAQHLETAPPSHLEAVHADRLIAIDCAVRGRRTLVTNSQSDQALCDEIAGRVEGLVREIAADARRTRESESSR